MTNENNTIAICGAGIAGIATAYYLIKNNPSLTIVLIDKNQPLSFTTSKSGENFRDFWPQKCMREFASYSIQLMQKLRDDHGDESFKMSYSGYNFISKIKDKPIFSTTAKASSQNYYEEISDSAAICDVHSYLSTDVEKIVSIKNAGNIDVYAMGSLMLKEAKKSGVKFIEGEIKTILKKKPSYEIVLDSKITIVAKTLVIASGPFINHIANMIGLQLPIENILQRKFIIPDPKNIIPRNMPFTIFADAQYLNWSKEEKEFFASEEKYQWLLEELPAGLHIKPEGEGIKLGWAFNTKNELPQWETPFTDIFPQVVLKGACSFIPQLIEYENDIPTPITEYAGYYTRTKENWPLIGPTEMPNVFLIGALSGYGTMTACAAGQLCSKYILNATDLPDYAPYFHPNKYQNLDIVKEINAIKSDGQL
ncbi:FAD-binding oxidoreductase [Flavobacteriaceae bacterium KMM 6897]|nr:FAD-binding oxidoreductase [Flavobacteriaceae bacterium KMM 6897]